jgi:CheY-like chemotaxis protein
MNAVRTILFVENDLVALRMYSQRLEREGFHLDPAQDGLEAIRKMSRTRPDLMVLDMMLPKLGGVEVLKFIRSDSRLKTLPVVIFSNASWAEMPLDAVSGGRIRHLLKSDCTFPMLLQTIQELLADTADGASDTLPKAEVPASAHRLGANSPGMAPRRDPHPIACAAFVTEALAEMPKIREHCFAYIKAPASPGSLQHLPSLYQRVHFLSGAAVGAGCSRVAMLCKAFDELLSEIMVKPSWVTPSVLQTIAQAVDCLALLINSTNVDLCQLMPPAKVLAVDDDAVCNHVIVGTLKRPNFDAKCVDDPITALQLLQNDQYQLVLLDINMPDLTGFELCEKLRQFPHCKSLPVIFITGYNNFENRKQSVLSGGHDFITKPVSPSELALKATLHLLRASVQNVTASNAGAMDKAGAATKNEMSEESSENGREVLGEVLNSSIPLSGRSSECLTSEAALSAGMKLVKSKGNALFNVHGAGDGAQLKAPSAPSVGLNFELAHLESDSPQSTEIPECGPESTFDQVVGIVARILFEDETPTDRNLRLVRIALERYKLREILETPANSTARPLSGTTCLG